MRQLQVPDKGLGLNVERGSTGAVDTRLADSDNLGVP
jgi:hypothetical protein